VCEDFLGQQCSRRPTNYSYSADVGQQLLCPLVAAVFISGARSVIKIFGTAGASIGCRYLKKIIAARTKGFEKSGAPSIAVCGVVGMGS
jgi:hypothetical protein